MNKLTLRFLFCSLLIIFPFVTNAQTIEVKGVISDETGPLPGVSIFQKGDESVGTISDIDGNYAISGLSADAILVVSFVGYVSQEIPINGKTEINIVLASDTRALGEVIVVGYGTSVKRELTSAISTIKKREITNVVPSSPSAVLQGKIPGIQVETFGGQPGGKTNVFIRGVNSLSNAAPLFIVDGLYVEDMRNINVNDIVDVSVLKDAAAAAIYGARAANGVVLITTNHGEKDSDVEVSISLKTGIDTPSKKLSFINGPQYAAYLNQRFINDVQNGATADVTQWNGVDVDWQNENLKSTALVQDYGFSISGGGKNSSHYISGNTFNQDGILVGSGFERYNLRFNNQFDFRKRLHVSQSLGITQGKLQVNNWYGFDGTTAPTVPLRNANNEGGFEAPDIDKKIQGPGGTNHYARAVMEDNLYTSRSVFGNFKLDYDVTDFLVASVNFGVDYLNGHTYQFTPTFYMSPSAETDRNQNPLNDLTEYTQEDVNLQMEPTLAFNKEFDKNKVGIVLGYTYFLENQRGSGIYGQGTDSNEIRVVSGLAPSSQMQLFGNQNTAGLESYFGRLNYSYDQKYLFSVTVRRDASSRFAKSNQVGYFPSFSGGWNLSSEPFFPDTKIISYLKLRASYGELGSYPNTFYPTEAVFRSNQSNGFFGNATANGLSRLTLADKSIVWETTKTIDFGFDMSFLDNQINFSADYYQKDISDVLVAINIPSTSGVVNPVTRNAGTLINNGLEFVADYKQGKGDFTYTIGANISFNLKSEAGNLPNPIIGPPMDEDQRVISRTISGGPIGGFYGYKVAEKVDPATGDFVRLDTDGKAGITDDDRTIIGDPTPDFIYGFKFNGEYKNFDLTLGFNGVQGNDIYNLVKYFNIFTPDGGRLSDVLKAWTPTNTDTTIPKAQETNNNNKEPSSFFVEDGSYLRLKTLDIGYNIKKGFLSDNNFIKELRVAITVQNVFVITSYTGYDPDVSSTDGGRATLNSGAPGLRVSTNPLQTRGIDARAYPNARTFTFGVTATF